MSSSLLKKPQPEALHHLHYIDQVFKVFPDAKVVQSHRDSVGIIPEIQH